MILVLVYLLEFSVYFALFIVNPGIVPYSANCLKGNENLQ